MRKFQVGMLKAQGWSRTWFAVSFIAILFSGTAAGQIILNEVCNSNYDVIHDEYGEYADWIELKNTDSVPVNLAGYCLGDDAGNLAPWCFPEYLMAPGEHLFLFASGKDIGSSPVYWETVIDQGDEWTYILPGAGTPADWIEADFNDSSWSSGTGTATIPPNCRRH